MKKVEPKPFLPLGNQLKTLKNRKIFFAQTTTFLFLGGHTVLYAYFTPFLKDVAGFGESMVSVAYLIFGIAAVAGGGLGGIMGDRIGTRKSIFIVAIVFSCAIFSIPYTTFSFILFAAVMVIWGAMSWAMSPPMQSYLIETAPESSDIQQSINNSAFILELHLGRLSAGLLLNNQLLTTMQSLQGLLYYFQSAQPISLCVEEHPVWVKVKRREFRGKGDSADKNDIVLL